MRCIPESSHAGTGGCAGELTHQQSAAINAPRAVQFSGSDRHKPEGPEYLILGSQRTGRRCAGQRGSTLLRRRSACPPMSTSRYASTSAAQQGVYANIRLSDSGGWAAGHSHRADARDVIRLEPHREPSKVGPPPRCPMRPLRRECRL
jgi:hypothetical protein